MWIPPTPNLISPHSFLIWFGWIRGDIWLVPVVYSFVV